MKKTEG